LASPEEVAEALERIQARLTRFFAARVTDAFVRDDLIGRVNERILSRSDTQTTIEDLERFVFGVAKNVLLEHWRESQRRLQTEATLASTAENLVGSVTATVDASGMHTRGTMLAALHSCLEQLPAADRVLAQRCYGEERSKDARAALAAEMGIARNTLDARLSRLRAKLEHCVRRKISGQ